MIPEHILHKTRLVVASKLGWDFPPNRKNDLERGILSLANDLGIKETPESINSWLSDIAWNGNELDILTSYLTVGETYFFREKSGLDVFRKQIIPEIILKRHGKDQYLRIWCAGCCTGEEPYTLAILLREIIPDIKNWKITILATDINMNFIKKAQVGIYTPWSFRETSQTIKYQYFTHVGKNWEIKHEIKKMVTFAKLNLAEDHYPSTISNTHNMDVIFCRNVLMYFTPRQIKLVAKRFNQSLTENGWLIISAVELNDEFFSDFVNIRFEQGIFYRKVPKAIESSSLPTVNTLCEKVFSTIEPVPIRKLKPALPLACKALSSAPVPKGKDKNSPSPKEIQVLFEKGQYRQCVEQCLMLSMEQSLGAKTLTFLVTSYANIGNLTEARKWGGKLLSQDGITADSYYLVAAILMEENETAMAESTLKRALYLDPHHLLSHFLMGNILSRLGKKNVAAKHFQNVKELLAVFQENEVVPGSEGLTAGRMKSIVDTLVSQTHNH